MVKPQLVHKDALKTIKGPEFKKERVPHRLFPNHGGDPFRGDLVIRGSLVSKPDVDLVLNCDRFKFCGPFPNLFARRIGCFGTEVVNNVDVLSVGASQPSYLYEPLVQQHYVNLNLLDGKDNFEHMTFGYGRTCLLLEHLMRMSSPGSFLKNVVNGADFISMRGMVCRIASAPYDQKQFGTGFKMACQMYGGVVILHELKTEAQMENDSPQISKLQNAFYGGCKFEQCMTTDSLNMAPNTNRPVSMLKDCMGVFNTQIGHFPTGLRLLLAGEVDCIDKSGNCVELKTQKDSIRYGAFWAQKEMKWWLQSALVGIQRIVVGIRDNACVVNEIIDMGTNELIQNPQGWKPSICMNFLCFLLNTIRQQLVLAPEGTMLLCEHDPGDGFVYLYRLNELQRQEYQFLPYGFASHFVR